MELGTDRRLLAITVVALGLLAALFAVAFGSGDASATGNPVAQIEAKEASAEGLVAVPVHDPSPSEREVVPVKPVPLTPPPAEVPAGGRRVQGRVVVLDQHGEEHTEEHGRLEFVCWDESSGAHEVVPVVGGRFSIDLEPRTQLSLSSATLGERAVLPIRGRLEFDETIELRLRWPSATWLRVVDAETRVDLARVRVATASDWQVEDFAMPGELAQVDIVVDGGVSPIELLPEVQDSRVVREQRPYWVTAAGYAWGKIDIDHTNPTGRTLELVRGGDLDVSIVGQLFAGERPARGEMPRLRLRSIPDEAENEAKIRDYLEANGLTADSPQGKATADYLRGVLSEPSNSPPLLEVKARTDVPIHLMGLRPGSYRLSVERGEWFQTPIVLGAVSAMVEAGDRRSVTVPVEPPAERITVPLSGTLFVPPGWDLSGLVLRFDPLDLPGKTEADQPDISIRQMTPMAVEGLYRWDAGRVVPGRYEVTSYSLDNQWVVDTGPHGNENAEIRVGVPVDVRVQVLDDATGEALSDVEVHWHGQRAEGLMSGSLGSASWNADVQRYEFRAPAGGIQIRVFGSDYSTVGSPVHQVSPTESEFSVRVRRNCGVRLYLESEGVVVPWDSATEWNTKVKYADGRAAGHGQGSMVDGGRFLVVGEPGTVTLVIPDQPGFEPIEPFELVIPARTMVEHRVQLRRR